LGRSARHPGPSTFACVIVDRDGPRVSAEPVVGAAGEAARAALKASSRPSVPPTRARAPRGGGTRPRFLARVGADAAAAEQHCDRGIGLVQCLNRLSIGDRTRELDGAHVEEFSGIENSTSQRIWAPLLDKLNPKMGVGKCLLINRYGVNNVEKHLADRIAAVQRSGHIAVWACDPMHGKRAGVAEVFISNVCLQRRTVWLALLTVVFRVAARDLRRTG
ncbi:MAG: class-II DAHP synthetase family-domain-containing protein, partial [Olpidium bornovanus]